MSKLGFGVRPQAGTDNKWECYDIASGSAVLSGVTNQEAWREVDRRMNEAVSRAEDVSDWLWRERLKS
jgi:hypothetical protein